MATIPITWNANDIASGVREIRGKWVNSPYLRGNALTWNPITSSFAEDGNGWQTRQCPVIVSAPRKATQPIRFVNGVAWDVHGATTIAASQNELLVQHPGASPVDGILLPGRESQIVYPNAITDGIDIAVGVWHGRGPRAEHIYVIRRMPSGTGDIEIASEVTAVGSRVDGWDGASLLEIDNTSIVDRQDDRRGWTLRPAVAWHYDAAGVMHKTPIVARMQLLTRGRVRVTKYVPRSLVEAALRARPDGELRCDLTGTFYPDASPETTTHDGSVFHTTSQTWATKRANATGTGNDDAAATMVVRLGTPSTSSQWSNVYFPQMGFDLSSLSGANASAGTLELFLNGAKTETLASQSLSFTPLTPASNTGSSTSDFAAHIAETTRIIDDVAVSAVTNSADNVFNFNATGVSHITSKCGSVMFISNKIASMTDNAEPTWISTKQARVDWQTMEEAGTTGDPKLVVTYTAGGGSSIAAIANHYARLRSN